MAHVGVRDLRDGLSRYLQDVADGGTIIVTDHGRPVARIVPITGRITLAELIASGRATPGRAPKGLTQPPIEAGGTVSDLVAEQRR